jgi:hypothetical protein
MLSFTQLLPSLSFSRVQMELVAAGSGSANLYECSPYLQLKFKSYTELRVCTCCVGQAGIRYKCFRFVFV